jgi:predicted anti-sigma-YlaC factor YlaD
LDNGAKISKWRVVFEMACAAFAGVLVMLMCQAMNMSVQWTGVVVGVCGWLGGAAAMRLLERVVTRKVGVNDVQADRHAEE